jgi:hypothetical protein
MQKTQPSTPLELLLKDYCSPESFAMALDEAMLSMILLLRYEPEALKNTVYHYEKLYILRSLIVNPEIPHQP